MTIGLFLIGNFLFYLMVGSLSMYVSLWKNREEISLCTALAAGICGGLLWKKVSAGMSAVDYLKGSAVFLAGTILLFGFCLHRARRRDFQTETMR